MVPSCRESHNGEIGVAGGEFVITTLKAVKPMFVDFLVITRRCLPMFVAGIVSLMLATAPILAQESVGQGDLDKATELRVKAGDGDAQTRLEKLQEVVELCESALMKGLDDDNKPIAKELMKGALVDRATMMTTLLKGAGPQLGFLRKEALRDLNKAIGIDPDLGEAHYLMAQLFSASKLDHPKALKAATEAIRCLKDAPEQLAEVHILRGKIVENREEKLKDFTAAVEADPKSIEALVARAAIHLTNTEEDPEKSSASLDKGIADLQKAMEIEPTNEQISGLLIQAFAAKGKVDEALKLIDARVEKAKSKEEKSRILMIRARLNLSRSELDKALEDLNQAIKIDGTNAEALLLRSRVHSEKSNFDAARKDVEAALAIDPDQEAAIQMRIDVAASQGRFGEAIADLRTLLREDPRDVGMRLHLAGLLRADKRPRQAIEVYTQLLDDPLNDRAKALVWQGRAEAYLSIGKHKEAVSDYEEAIKFKADDSSLLNNFAWLLATSFDDEVRNAKRSIELGTKACEVTEFKKAHILSTLAAGYAEDGQWEKAIEWSTKAVELGADDDETGDQLKKELESYKQKKPWREKQELPENEKKIEAAEGDLET